MTDTLNSSNGGSSSFFRKRRRVTEHTPSFSALHPGAPLSDGTTSGTASTPDSRPTTAIRSEDQVETHISPPKRSHHRRDSSLSSFTDLKSSIRRRSTSLRTKATDAPSFWDKLAPSSNHADKRLPNASRPQLNISTLTNQSSIDNIGLDRTHSREPTSAVEPRFPQNNQLQHALSQGVRRDEINLRPATALGTPYSGGIGSRAASSTNALSNMTPSSASSSDPRSVAQKITDIANKRITLLNYLRTM